MFENYGAVTILSAACLSLLPGLSVRADDPLPAPPWQHKVDPWVLQATAGGAAEFLVMLQPQADLRGAAALATKADKGRFVHAALTRTAAATQGPLLAALKARGVAHRPYWVANMIWVHGDAATLAGLASRAEVAHIYANPAVKLAEPPASTGAAATQAPTGVEWNIGKVNAPAVWAAGYRGQGAVIGGQDTGYQWDHPALKTQYRGWNGTAANHDYHWHDAIHGGGGSCGADAPFPCDDGSHGTHTMGTMVGDDGGANQIGMAPGARWIGCRNMNQGVGTPATYAECYQWFIAPTRIDGSDPDPAAAPAVINNSWGCPPSEGCTDPYVLQAVVQNVRAAGILTVHSAGNSGSACSTVAEPAAIYAESFSIGATDSNDAIASFSSRGPVTVDGSDRSKPNVSAPGVNIRSSVPGSGYAGGWNGTSMAGPHVAGLVALLISAEPSLAGQVDDLEDSIEQSALGRTSTQTCGALPGSGIPNNTFGWGRIDALAAYHIANGVCQAGALTIAPFRFGPGEHRRASGVSLATQGTVEVLTGADLTFRAPLHRYGPGFRVASGTRFQARAEPVTCGTASRPALATARNPVAPAQTTPRVPATVSLAAPWPIARPNDLPGWLQDLLIGHGIDPAAIEHGLLDPAGQWLVFETAQGLDPGDRNETSDIHRLDLTTGTLALLSRTPAGRAGNGPSRYAAADGLGDRVVFQSAADDLVADDGNAVSDIFLYEVPFGTLRRVTAHGEAAAHPALDAAGQDLLYDQTGADGRRQVLADRPWGGAPAEPPGPARDASGVLLDHHHPAISADGRFIASLETSGSACQVRLFDRDRGRVRRVACPAALATASEEARPAFSPDGAQVEWTLPGEDGPIVVPNALLTILSESVP